MKKEKLSKRARLIRTLRTLILIAIVIAGLSIVAVRYVYDQNLKPVAASQKSTTVTIPLGYTLPQITKLLKQKGLIRSEWAFKQYVRNNQADNDIKAGTYELSSSYSVPEIVSIITLGKIKTNLLTILPGKTITEIKEAFIKNGFSQETVESAFNPDLYKDHPALVDKPAGVNLEGYLYPDSYQKNDTTTAKEIIILALNEMQKQLTPELRAAIAKQNISVYQGIILASIVEKEADKPTDRTQVAQVLLTRLNSGMNLQSDVTAFYGAVLDGQPKSVNYDSPYNTYLHAGLPKGPISNVSKSSVEAIAYPANTDYLYFLAGDDGTVYFSHTAAEHQAKIDQYCKKLCSNP